MGKAVGIALGLMIGFLVGLVARGYWDERLPPLTTPPSVASEQNSGYAERYFICKYGQSNLESALIIKGDRSGAKTMTFSWKSNGDEFRIEETTDLYYKAVEASPEASEAYSSLELNRVSGELFMTSRVSNDAVKLLAAGCDKRIQPNECGSRMKSIRGGDLVSCMSTANDLECSRWRSGTNFGGRYRYECRSAERRF